MRLLYGIFVLLLAGCVPNKYYKEAADGSKTPVADPNYQAEVSARQHARTARQAFAKQLAASCADDMCRVFSTYLVMQKMDVGVPVYNPPKVAAAQLMDSTADLLRAATPIASLYIALESQVDLARQIGQTARAVNADHSEQGAAPDNSISLGDGSTYVNGDQDNQDNSVVDNDSSTAIGGNVGNTDNSTGRNNTVDNGSRQDSDGRNTGNDDNSGNDGLINTGPIEGGNANAPPSVIADGFCPPVGFSPLDPDCI